ncbi:MAG TPA: PspA/IM30 family protein [Halomicronema sp.]
MGLFDRIFRVVRANFNSLVSAAEDPEKILEQAVMDLQEDLVQLRQAVAGAIASQKRTERQCSQTQSSADEWYRRAQLALQKGDENLAREALSRRKTYQETAKALSGQIEQQTVIVSQLKQNMRVLESKIADAKTKKDMYIARARSARASEKLNELAGHISAGGTVNAFERMEEKVLQLEARSQAIADLGADTLEKQFASLEGSTDVDAELATMKNQMLKSSNPHQLPPPV